MKKTDSYKFNGETMYGYVTPKKDCLLTRDFVLYRAFYCGICKSTGNKYGQFPRFTTNYDIVFLSVLLHDILSQEVEFRTAGCILNPIKKKTSICRNELLDRLIATNIILSYFKIKDDIEDKDGHGKRTIKSLLKKAYKSASSEMPNINGIIKYRYGELRALEKEGRAGIDRSSHCFSQLLSETAKELLGEKANDEVLKLCYNIGKFVYLADALDDIDEDNKKKRYNPFLVEFGGYKNRKQFIADNNETIKFIFSVTVNRAIECFNNITFTQSYDLMKNIVHNGLRAKCDELLDSTKKLPRPKI